MRIVRYGTDRAPSWGIVEDDVVFATEGQPFQDLTKGNAVGHLDDVSLLAPVHPRTIMCIGRNYHAHAEEFGNTAPTQPLLFLKPPTTVIAPGAPIVYPHQSARVDPEAELVVVMGKPAYQVSREDAYDYIGGYTCGNDVTARDLQKSDPGEQWTRGKGFATFCPIGPWIETELDPSDLRITCTVDGDARQDGRTSSFIFDIPFLIEYITSFVALEPGDILMTGTPEGVAPIDPGMTVTVEIENIGSLSNPVAKQDR